MLKADLVAQGLHVLVTREELALLSNCIGETIETVEDWEFVTRVGVERDEVRRVRDQIHDILRQAGGQPD